jgi:hypothetical protein
MNSRLLKTKMRTGYVNEEGHEDYGKYVVEVRWSYFDTNADANKSAHKLKDYINHFMGGAYSDTQFNIDFPKEMV